MKSEGPARSAVDVAIVGGGFSGTMAAAQLVRRGLSVVLVEGGGRSGRGIAYSTRDPVHLLNVPAAKVREMIYTGRRFTAEELQEHSGFFNYIVPKEQVMPRALELAEVIAAKPLAALKVNKLCNNASETMSWTEAYKLAQTESAKLTVTRDAKEGIRAFLEKRTPAYKDQ